MSNDANIFEQLGITEDTESKSIDLKALDTLVSALVAVQGTISRAEDELKKLKAAEYDLAVVKIPELMSAAGFTYFERTDGFNVEIAEEFHVSLPKVRQKEIFELIRGRGGSELISNQLEITIGKGKDNMAGEIEAQAKELGLETNRVEAIHASTYKKWITLQSKSDKPIDLAFFGAHRVTKAKIVK